MQQFSLLHAAVSFADISCNTYYGRTSQFSSLVSLCNFFHAIFVVGDMSEDDQQALKEIAEFFEQPNKDLQELMDTFFPEVGFKGFTCVPCPFFVARTVSSFIHAFSCPRSYESCPLSAYDEKT
jgi:hypothetical protein